MAAPTTWRALSLATLILLAASVACSGDAQTAGTDASAPDAPSGDDGGASTPDTAPAADVGPASGDTGPAGCSVQLASPPSEGGMHVNTCSPVSYGSKPPSSGSHYPSWPIFRAYDKPVPWGYLVHGLEHGAVVIAYRCDNGCPGDIAAAKALIAKLPPKAGCKGPAVILTPDPKLDVPFAASAWGQTLRATCFDAAAFELFIRQHAEQGPEKIPGDCGAVDLEASGWCPGAP